MLIEQLAIQGGLLQAVFYLSGISEWKFYATVLLEKIQQISMMSTANRRSLLVNDRAPEPYPGVDYLCIHDKGLGIRNTRQLIHKGQLIG